MAIATPADRARAVEEGRQALRKRVNLDVGETSPVEAGNVERGPDSERIDAQGIAGRYLDSRERRRRSGEAGNSKGEQDRGAKEVHGEGAFLRME